jgi:hypothetical protein
VCIRNASVTPRNTEYTKYDPPGAQVSDDALAQKYLLYTPPARLKLRYRELDDENTTTYGRISSEWLSNHPSNKDGNRNMVAFSKVLGAGVSNAEKLSSMTKEIDKF